MNRKQQQKQNPQDQQNQKPTQVTLKEQDQWIYESILQYIQTPVFKVPLMDFFDQNCVYFENTQEITQEMKQVFESYREIINNMVFVLSSDIEVDSKKIFELIQFGLQVKQHAKYFWTFRIFYHVQDFVRYMIKKNYELEKQAFQELGQSQQINNQKSEDIQQQLLIQQQIINNQQMMQDKELEKAIQDSLALEELRKQQGEGDDDQQMKDLEAALALSKLEHDEHQKRINNQQDEEEEIKKALELSKLDQQYNFNNQNQKLPPIQNKILSSAQHQPILESQKLLSDNNLLDLSDNDIQFKDNDVISQQEFDQQVFQDRQNLLKGLDNLDTSSIVQQEQSKQQSIQKETLEDKKERLKKQREALLARKKQQREEEVKEYTQKNVSPREGSSPNKEEMEQRKRMYEKINSNLQNL